MKTQPLRKFSLYITFFLTPFLLIGSGPLVGKLSYKVQDIFFLIPELLERIYKSTSIYKMTWMVEGIVGIAIIAVSVWYGIKTFKKILYLQKQLLPLLGSSSESPKIQVEYLIHHFGFIFIIFLIFVAVQGINWAYYFVTKGH